MMKNIPAKENIKKILVFKFGGLGDYLNIMPFLEDLRIFYPGAEISAVTSPAGKELLEHKKHVDRCIVSQIFYKQGSESVFSIDAVKDIFTIKKRLDAPYDLYIDLVSKYSRAGSLKPFIVKLISHPRFSVGLNCMNRARFLDLKVPEERNEIKHNIERYNDVLRALGGSPVFHLPSISQREETHRAAMDYFLPYKGKLKIGIHPGANAKFFSHRAWPVERFALLAEKLDSTHECSIFATGSEAEENLVHKLQELSKVKIYRVPAQSGIIDFCAYLKQLDYFISNDTGPMHLAVAMNVPTLGIFGHADYESYGTYPEEVPFEAITLDKGEKNGPSPDTDDPRGLKNISVEMVYEHFEKLRERKK